MTAFNPHVVELSKLKDQFTECLDGYPSVAILSGRVGMGKTTLLHRLLREVTEEYDAETLIATASGDEYSHRLGVLEQLLRSRQMDAAPDLFRGITQRNQETVAPADDSHDVGRVFNHAWETLSNALTQRALVVAVDNMHYADSLSLAWLAALLRRLPKGRLFVVASVCPGLSIESLQPAAEFMRMPRSIQVTLEPMTASAVVGLARAEFGIVTNHDSDRIKSVLEISGGAPRLVHALLSDGEHISATRELEPSRAFSEAAYVSVNACDRAAIECIYATAVLEPAEQNPSRIARLVGESLTGLTRRCKGLGLAGILSDGRFHHDHFRQAVLQTIEPGRRRDLHLAAAQTLYETGAPDHMVARHLLASGQSHHPWAAALLIDNAESAIRTHDNELARQLLHLACSAAAISETQLSRARIMLLRIEWWSDPAAAKRHLPQLVQASTSGHLNDAESHFVLACLLWSGLAEDALKVAGSTSASGWVWLTMAFPELSSQAPANTLEGATNNASAVVSLMLTRQRFDRPDDIGGGLLEWALCDGSTTTNLAPPLSTDVPRGMAWSDRILAEPPDPTSPTYAALKAAIRGLIALRTGNYEDAVTGARHALASIPAGSWGVAIGLPLSVAVLGNIALGALQDARALLAATPVPARMFDTPAGMFYLYSCARANLESGRFASALDDLQAFGERIARWGVDDSEMVPWRLDAAKACIGLGQIARAKHFMEQQLDSFSDERTRGIALRELATISDPDDRERLLHESAAALTSCGDEAELVYTLSHLAGFDLPMDPSIASAAAKQHDAAAEHDSSKTAAVYQLRRSWLPDNAQKLSRLSEAERRVAVLVARGRSNREAAGDLFVTISTVEQHLTRIYKKLDIASRGQLAEVLNLDDIPLLA